MDFAIPSYKKKPTLAVEHVIAKKKKTFFMSPSSNFLFPRIYFTARALRDTGMGAFF